MICMMMAAALNAGQAQAQTPVQSGTTAPDGITERASEQEPILVEATQVIPSVVLMNDHMHEGGEVMIGVRFENTRWSGAHQRGTRTIADAAIVAAGYRNRTRRMAMDMLMLDLMVAPSDRLTLMLMPHYMWHRMEMIGIDPAGGEDGGGGHGGHGGHALPFGEVHQHKLQGFGDTLASASFGLARNARFKAHATFGMWIPTGDVNRKNADGTFVHYGMQPGSGTWDVEPSLTLSGQHGGVGWGAQAAYRWRVAEANASGFRFGDRARLTGWLSLALSPAVGATARLEYAGEGKANGHYSAAHNHVARPDRQENYGGQTVSAALGVSWRPRLARAFRPELGAEFAVPLHQDVNGIQAPEDWRLTTAIRQTF